MVEYTLSLDSAFGALADQTRRDILSRVARQELTVGEIAEPYKLTFAAVSKHLKVLERARLIVKHRQGKQQVVQAVPQALVDIDAYLQQYRLLWETRLDALDKYLSSQEAEL